MKHLLLTTIAAVLLVGCGNSQQSTPLEEQPAEPVSEVPAQQSTPPAEAQPVEPIPAEAQPVEPIVETAQPSEDTKVANPIANRALMNAARDGNIEVLKQQLAAGADVNAKDDKGLTAFDWFKDEETAALLRKHGGKSAKELETEGK